MLKILIVDDSPIQCAAVAKMIERMGHIPIIATGGQQGIDLFIKEMPSLVLLDAMMPEVDGYEVAKTIRTLYPTSWVPIIFLSSNRDEQDLNLAIDAGGDDYLIKPVSFVVLSAKIRAMQRIDDIQKKLLTLSQELETANRDLAKVNGELEKVSHQDGLTGIANRRYFDFYINQELNRAKRTQTPFSIILGDVDHFKLYNDHYGHLAGDECLRRVSKSIDETCRRPSDLCARYGGEEFVIVLPETNIEGAIGVANYIQKNLHEQMIPHDFSSANKIVTMSMGVYSLIPNLHTTPESMLLKADEALYKAKQTGRDRFVCFND